MALSGRAKLLFCSATADPDVPIVAVWWLPGGCHGNPAIVCWDLSSGKAACPRHRYPEALPSCQPLICKQTQQRKGLLAADPDPHCVCRLLDAFLPLGVARRRIQPSSVHLCHLGASGGQLTAEPDTLQSKKQRYSKGAAPGLLPAQMHTKHTHTLPCRCVTAKTRQTHTTTQAMPDISLFECQDPHMAALTIIQIQYMKSLSHTHIHTPTQARSTSPGDGVPLQIRMFCTILAGSHFGTKRTVFCVLCASSSVNCSSTGFPD